mgnify:CR=1 FL=1
MEKCVLLIPAAGVGSRMKIGYPKQYMPLVGEKTLLELTVKRLVSMEIFDHVAVVVSAQDPYIEQQSLPSNVQILRCGGKSRGESVFNGLQALNLEENDWVFVHDAARPCVEKSDLLRLLSTLKNEAVDGALLAQPSTDTLKWVDSDGYVEKTLDRSRCWRAQTPQVFRFAPLVKALSKNPSLFTDEASAMEVLNARIKIVEGRATNIKVTHPEDAPLVRKFLLDLGESL